MNTIVPNFVQCIMSALNAQIHANVLNICLQMSILCMAVYDCIDMMMYVIKVQAYLNPKNFTLIFWQIIKQL